MPGTFSFVVFTESLEGKVVCAAPFTEESTKAWLGKPLAQD